jgi:hypothetical protein
MYEYLQSVPDFIEGAAAAAAAGEREKHNGNHK